MLRTRSAYGHVLCAQGKEALVDLQVWFMSTIQQSPNGGTGGGGLGGLARIAYRYPKRRARMGRVTLNHKVVGWVQDTQKEEGASIVIKN